MPQRQLFKNFGTEGKQKVRRDQGVPNSCRLEGCTKVTRSRAEVTGGRKGKGKLGRRNVALASKMNLEKERGPGGVNSGVDALGTHEL